MSFLDPHPPGYIRNEDLDPIKPEILPTVLHGDGKPLDVGTDRILANNLNLWIDAKSCVNLPMLVQGGTSSELAFANLSGSAMPTGKALYIYPVVFGLEIVSTAITRVLIVAPWFRSSDGSSAEIRITITNQLPQKYPAAENNEAVTGYYGRPLFNGKFSASSVWSTTSTTWAKGADAELDLGVKDNLGICWLVVEGSGKAECRGLAKMREGARRAA